MPPKFTMPLGVIIHSDRDRPQFYITTEHYAQTLVPDTPITVWSYHEGTDSLSRVRGTITRIDHLVATFTIVDKKVDPSWPQHRNPIIDGACVYEASHGTYRAQGLPITDHQDLDFLHDLLTNQPHPPIFSRNQTGFTQPSQQSAAGPEHPPTTSP